MNVMAASRYPAKSKYSFTAQLRSFRSLSFRGPNAEIFTSCLSCSLMDPSRVATKGALYVEFLNHVKQTQNDH